jgi:hypothetical protein
MKWPKWFLAGALAVPLGHQIAAWALHAIGWFPAAPFSFAATKPFGVPQLLSLSFWGGVWGLILGLVLARTRTPRVDWLTALVFGAIAPTLVAALVVMPLKGIAMASRKLAVAGLVVNGTWGVVSAALAKAWDATSRNSRA